MTTVAAGWKKTATPDSGDDLRCPGFDPNLSDLVLRGFARLLAGRLQRAGV
mgnify:CR=1 FL=1